MLGDDFYLAIHEAELRNEDERRERAEQDAIEKAAPLGIYFRSFDNRMYFLKDGEQRPISTEIVTLSDPVTVRVTPTVQYTFFTAVDNTVHVYNGVNFVPIAGVDVNTVTRVSAVNLHRMVHIFAVAANGELYHSCRDLTTSDPFSEFTSIGGELVPGEQVCVIPQREDNSLCILANDYRLGAAAIRYQNESFSAWVPIGMRVHSSLSGVSLRAGHYDAFGTHNGKLVHLWHDAEVLQWRSFENILPNSACLGGAGGCAVLTSKDKEELHVFFQGPDAQLMHVVRDAHQWQPSVDLGGLLSHPPEARWIPVDNAWRIQVVTRWADGRIYLITQKDEPGKWQQWQAVECFAAGVPSV